MRITLKPLSKKELFFVLRILNLNWHTTIKELSEIEGLAASYSREAAAQQLKTSQWRDKTGSPRDDLPHRVLKGEWIKAQESWTQVVVTNRNKSGFWFTNLPTIGLPAQDPPVILRDPGDLTYWFLVRAVANAQHLRFVKCSRFECGKFGLRDRARAQSRYCSAGCQLQDNADRSLQRASGRIPKRRPAFEITLSPGPPPKSSRF